MATGLGLVPGGTGHYFAVNLSCLVCGPAFKSSASQKPSLKKVKQLKPDESPLHTVKQINNILKRVVLSYANRSDVAELSGTAWADWLNRYSAPNYKINNEFVSLAYATKCQPEQAEAYLQQAKLWVSKNLPLNPKFKKEAAAHV